MSADRSSDEVVRKLVDQAPPLTDAQVAQLRAAGLRPSRKSSPAAT
jgi:hypothetical protein